MLRLTTRLVTTAAAFLVSATAVQAFMGDCLLEVDRRIYLDGPCDIGMNRDGSFTIGVGNRRSDYFAYVDLDPDAPGVARGYWNGAAESTHAHDDLGHLSRHGGCWINDKAKVCAWKFGTRPN